MKRREFLGTVAAGMAVVAVPVVAFDDRPSVGEETQRRWQNALRSTLDYRRTHMFSHRSIWLLHKYEEQIAFSLSLDLIVQDCKAREKGGEKSHARLKDSIKVTSRIEGDTLITDIESDAGKCVDWLDPLSKFARLTDPPGFMVTHPLNQNPKM